MTSDRKNSETTDNSGGGGGCDDPPGENCQADKKKGEENGDESKFDITFCPPVYLQRYGRVRDELQKHLENLNGTSPRAVLEMGCAEFGMHFHLKHLPNVQKIIYMDVDKEMLLDKLDNVRYLPFESLCKRETPLVVEVYSGCATKCDKRIKESIPPVEAIIGVEILEHLNKDVEEKFIYNIFNNYAPPLIVLTTPNKDFNTVFRLKDGEFRHWDHRFELTRQEFADWCQMVCQNFPRYDVRIEGIGAGPAGTENLGCVSQMAVFSLKADCDKIPTPVTSFTYHNPVFRIDRPDKSQIQYEGPKDMEYFNNQTQRGSYDLLLTTDYPWEVKPPMSTRVVQEIQYYLNMYLLNPSNPDLDDDFESGPVNKIFVGMDEILTWLKGRVWETDAPATDQILTWLKEEGNFDVVNDDQRTGIEVSVPEEMYSDDEREDSDLSSFDGCQIDENAQFAIGLEEDWDA